MSDDKDKLAAKIKALAGTDSETAEGIVAAVVESQKRALDLERERVIAGGGESKAWQMPGD